METEKHSGLYLFDPITHEAKLHIAMPQDSWFVDMSILSDGSIWLMDIYSEALFVQYFPKTGELDPYQGTFSYFPGDDILYEHFAEGPRSILYLDRDNRLWVDDRGYFVFSPAGIPSWHRVIRSPVFIEAKFDGTGNFYWSRPRYIYQSSDGLLWFSAPVGVVRLDTLSGEWCLFTTYHSQVVEDDNHNLWIVADGQLYQYQLEQ